MKKSLLSLLLSAVFLFSFVLTACDSKQAVIPVGAYVFEASEEIIKPSVTLHDDGKFTFMFSALSSYIGRGEYKIDSNELELITDDEKNKYVFTISEKGLIFNSGSSSSSLWHSDISDGVLFEPREEM